MTAVQARIGFIILGALTAAKGILPSIHDDEMYFWFVNYHYGLTRRALVGSILGPFAETMTLNQLGILLRLIDLATFVVILSFTWRWLKTLRDRFSDQTVGLFGAVFATSPFLGLLAYHVGYPDGLAAVLVIAGALALRNALIGTFAVILVAASLTHELALLLLLPLAAWGAINCRPWSKRHYLVLALVGLACCLTVIAEGHARPEIIDSLTKHLEAIGVSPKSAAFQVHASLTQQASQTILMMRQVWAHDRGNAVLETVYAAAPGATILALALPNLRRSVEGQGRLSKSIFYALFMASGLCPILLLALAFDTSRLASFSTLTSVLTVGLLVSHKRQSNEASAGLRAASVLVATAYLVCPVMDLHPWYAQPLNLRRVSIVCGPCAKIGMAFGDFINRRRTAEQQRLFDSDPDYGN